MSVVIFEPLFQMSYIHTSLHFFRLKKAVQLINSLDTTKFPLLLSRIVQKLHLRVSLAVAKIVIITIVIVPYCLQIAVHILN